MSLLKSRIHNNKNKIKIKASRIKNDTENSMVEKLDAASRIKYYRESMFVSKENEQEELGSSIISSMLTKIKDPLKLSKKS